MKFLGIDFAPVNTPLHRRLETLAALGWVVLMLGGQIGSWTLFIWGILCSPLFRIPFLIYGIWIMYDAHRGPYNNRLKWARNWIWWKLFANYFPITITKKSELSPDKSYIFAVFPHGILATGPFISFGSNACHFEKVFPGLTPHVVTLAMNFYAPFLRELSFGLGSIPATESYILHYLFQKGHALALVVGGAQEAFYTKPGQYNVFLSKRKGFIRVALRTGASLVPTISFGEPEIYDQIQCQPGSFLRWTQDTWKKYTGIAPIYLVGRGIFQYTYGLLPFRKRITVVAGNPIAVERNDIPTQEDINNLHEKFCKNLIELFEMEKHKYIENSENIRLNII